MVERDKECVKSNKQESAYIHVLMCIYAYTYNIYFIYIYM